MKDAGDGIDEKGELYFCYLELKYGLDDYKSGQPSKTKVIDLCSKIFTYIGKIGTQCRNLELREQAQYLFLFMDLLKKESDKTPSYMSVLKNTTDTVLVAEFQKIAQITAGWRQKAWDGNSIVKTFNDLFV